MIRRCVFVILTVLWMAVIFSFSSRSGDVSAQDSSRVGMVVGHLFIPGFDSWSEEKQQMLAERIDHPVRKTAHATEYAVLGILILLSCRIIEKRSGAFAWMLGTLYACTDEFHQLFVPGRSGMIRDICIDSGGCMAGILILLLAAAVRRWRINVKKIHNENR